MPGKFSVSLFPDFSPVSSLEVPPSPTVPPLGVADGVPSTLHFCVPWYEEASNQSPLVTRPWIARSLIPTARGVGNSPALPHPSKIPLRVSHFSECSFTCCKAIAVESPVRPSGRSYHPLVNASRSSLAGSVAINSFRVSPGSTPVAQWTAFRITEHHAEKSIGVSLASGRPARK